MRNFAWITTVAFLGLGLLPAAVEAEPMVVLTSPDDLSSIGLGEEVRIDVRLQGVPVPLGQEFIFLLNTEALYPTGLFDLVPDPSWSSGLTPGAVSGTDPDGTAENGLFIIETQRTNFNALSSFDESAGVVQGLFSDSSPVASAAINQNGLFYSFTLRPTGLGSGQVAFAPTGNTYFSNLSTPPGVLVPLPTGGPLTVAVVPEPASATLLLVGGALLGLPSRRLARRPAVA